MTTFALIAEGATDQIILERIILQLCDEQLGGDVDVNFLQPLRDTTDTVSGAHAGWELVLEWCQRGVQDALSTNDFVVIHLDTDVADHINFGVALTEGGSDRADEDVIADVEALIIARMGQHIHAPHAHRFIFAVCVHSTETWLLLILFQKDRPKNAFHNLQREIQRANWDHLKKEVRPYLRLSKEIRRKRVLELSDAGRGLGKFVEAVRTVCGSLAGAAESE